MTIAVLAPRRDARLTVYVAIAGIGICVSLLSGDIEPMTVAAVATVLTLVGLRRARNVTIGTQVDLQSRRVLEGDSFRLQIHVSHPPDLAVEARLVGISTDLGAIETVATKTSPGSTSFAMTIPAPDWGRFALGQLIVRGTSPTAMCTWERSLGDQGKVTVLPDAKRLSRLLAPRASRSSSGVHPAKSFAGHGADFMDIRAYVAGDRLRDLNWRATARRGEPHINRREPERSGEVVVLLDATPDGGWKRSELGSEVLQRAGQATWALVRNHLAAQDRVGLMTSNSAGIDWLPPAGGSRAKFRILEALLGANELCTRSGSGSRWLRHEIPPSALVIGVSSLSNDETLRSIAALRSHGRATCMLAIDYSQLVKQTDEIDRVALRLAASVFATRVAYVRRLGTPVVTWMPGDDLDRVVQKLSELTRRSAKRAAAR